MHGSSPAGITKWPLGLMVMTAASQAANVEFKSRRGHLWVGRIAASAAGLHSVSVGSKPTSTGRCEPVNPLTLSLRWFESNPDPYVYVSEMV